DAWTASTPTQLRRSLGWLLAWTAGTPEHRIGAIVPDVGGGFGGKLQVTPEELITCLAAERLVRPVKYVESRAETMVSGHHGRDMIQDVTITARRDGTVTGLSVKLLANMGAYLGIITPGTPLLGA